MKQASGGFCKHCGNWVDASERCSCHQVRGSHWGSGSADEPSPAQENAIRFLEDALSLLDDDFWNRAA